MNIQEAIMKLNKNTKTLDLQKDKPGKIFWFYAVPSILAILLQSTAGLIDSIFIGRYIGEEGLSAITLVMPIITFLIGFSTMIAIGGTTLAGIYKGRDDHEKSNNFYNITLVLIIFFAGLSMFIVLALGSNFATLLGASGVVSGYITNYVLTLALFYIPFLLNFAMTYFLKLDGKPVIPVIAVSFGMVINILLDYLFIVKYAMGMKGAALATGISQLLPMMILLYLLINHSNWQLKKPIFVISEIKQILLNGSSELLSIASVSIASLLYNFIIISRVGLQGVAAFSVAVQVSSLTIGVFYGFAEAIQGPISVNYGAKNYDRVKKFRALSIQSNTISGIVICLSLFLFGRPISQVFITNSETVATAYYILKFYGISYLFAGLNITAGTYYTAINSPLLSGGLTLLRSLVALVVGLIVLPYFFGEAGVWSAIIFAEVISYIAATLVYKRWPLAFMRKNDFLISKKLPLVNNKS